MTNSFVNFNTPVENAAVHWNVWLYDNMDLVWDRSPIKHIRNAKTPTLIGHGERAHQIDFCRRALEWYLKYLKKNEEASD